MLWVMPGVSAARPKYVFDVGSVSISSRDRFSWLTTFCTSITGLAPETVTVSSIDPTVIVPSTFAVKSETSSIPSRTNVLNPGNVNVTAIGASPQRLDRVQTRSVSDRGAHALRSSAGLATSTVTPGSTPPVSSVTLPAMAPVWASAATGSNSMHAATAAPACFIRIQFIDSSSGLTAGLRRNPRVSAQRRMQTAKYYTSGTCSQVMPSLRRPPHSSSTAALPSGDVRPHIARAGARHCN